MQTDEITAQIHGESITWREVAAPERHRSIRVWSYGALPQKLDRFVHLDTIDEAPPGSSPSPKIPTQKWSAVIPWDRDEKRLAVEVPIWFGEIEQYRESSRDTHAVSGWSVSVPYAPFEMFQPEPPVFLWKTGGGPANWEARNPDPLKFDWMLYVPLECRQNWRMRIDTLKVESPARKTVDLREHGALVFLTL